MNTFLLIFFAILGVAGLVYQVDVGVFTGLGLLPWQVIRLKKGKKINLAAIGLAGAAGSIYFIIAGEWKLLPIFLFIISYNYWGHLQTMKRVDEENQT